MSIKARVKKKRRQKRKNINNFETVNEIIGNPKKFQNYYEKISEIYDELPYKFRQKLRYLRESLGLTREQLEEKSYISAQTIKQIENNEDRGYTVETVIALCVGMQLPPELSFDLLKMAGFSIEDSVTPINGLYCFILRNLYEQGIDSANEFLILNKEQPLTQQTTKE